MSIAFDFKLADVFIKFCKFVQSMTQTEAETNFF